MGYSFTDLGTEGCCRSLNRSRLRRLYGMKPTAVAFISLTTVVIVTYDVSFPQTMLNIHSHTIWMCACMCMMMSSHDVLHVTYITYICYIYIYVLEYLHDEIFVKLYFRFFLQTNRELSWDRLCRRWWHRRLS